MDDKFSEAWYKGIEDSKEKARKLLKQVIGVNQTTSLVIGRLDAVEIDKLAPGHHAACKVTLSKVKRFALRTKFKFRDEETGIFFVNKPEMILNTEELEKNFPEIYEEIHINIKKGAWDGS